MNQLLQEAVLAHQSGDIEKAESLYRSILQNEPNQPDVMALLGVICGLKGLEGEALSLIEKAIAQDKNSALFKFHYGNVLMSFNRLPQAIVAFRQSIVLKPSFSEAYYNLANALRASDDWGGAITAYRDAIKRKSSYHEAHNNLALCYVHEKDYTLALYEAQQSVKLAPEYGDGWITICNVAEKLKDYELGIMAGERAVQLLPSSHFAWFGYGVVLNRVDRNEEAIEAYQKALTLKPDRTDIWDNLGQTYQSLNRLEEAEVTYRKTIEIANQILVDEDKREIGEDEFGNRHWHLALMELLRGKYKLGFSRYRSRFKKVGELKRPSLPHPLWLGEDVLGKILLIFDEQGFGDTLMLSRYLPLLKERGAKIIFSVHQALKPLYDCWDGVTEVITTGTEVDSFDYYASTFDLPYRFGTTLETIPSKVPYLPRLMPLPTHELPFERRLKVGVVWGGNPMHSNDSRRSIPLAVFAEIFKIENIKFYSLNREYREGDDEILALASVEDLSSRIHNFADSARFIEQMDLIISCDTSTAHLAGGLGKPVWILLPFAPDWRWMINRDDNLWYPTARLFRQTIINNWKNVISGVVKELRLIAK